MLKPSCNGEEVTQCFRFMRLFGISMFSVLRSSPNEVHAFVAWPDACADGLPDREDVQEIVWRTVHDDGLDDALSLAECVRHADGISTDRLTISQEKMQVITGWDSNRVQRAIDLLLHIRVQRIDDGKEGDPFFLHR